MPKQHDPLVLAGSHRAAATERAIVRAFRRPRGKLARLVGARARPADAVLLPDLGEVQR